MDTNVKCEQALYRNENVVAGGQLILLAQVKGSFAEQKRSRRRYRGEDQKKFSPTPLASFNVLQTLFWIFVKYLQKLTKSLTHCDVNYAFHTCWKKIIATKLVYQMWEQNQRGNFYDDALTPSEYLRSKMSPFEKK